MFEILSPAGSFESLKAAVSAGADAVYMGGNKFNARESAENFDQEQLTLAVKYCHLRNVKVYITLNTVVSDLEIKEIIPYVIFLRSIGVDALIIQSPGLAKVIKEICPDFEIHASTQMTVHNLHGVLESERQGFSRVVLSRELSKENLEYITENSPIEIEVFVHGALCMCYSGQCYMSSVIGQRSGNRGKCAQPCRQKYKNGYELSLKDLSMAKEFTKLLELNIHSLKIEGRLKSPDYVYGVTRIYRQLVDEKRNATEDEIKYLEALFSRQGFTNNYFKGIPAKKMFGIRDEKDKHKTRALEKEKYEEKRIPVNISYDFSQETCKVVMKGLNKTAEIESSIAQAAQNCPLSKDEINIQLSKLGNFPFYVKNITGNSEDNLFIPKAALNGLKRECAETLCNEITKTFPASYKTAAHTVENILPSNNNFNFIFEGNYNFKKIETFAKDCNHMWVNCETYQKTEFSNIGVKLPRIITDNEIENINRLLQNAIKNGAKKALCYTLSQVELVKNFNLMPYTAFSLNVFNSYDLEHLKEIGVTEACVSFECSLPIIKSMNKPLPVTACIYGKMPVMVTENCIIRNSGKCIEFNGKYDLTDKTGETFTVLCHPPHRNLILNSKPIILSDKLDDFKKAGISGYDLIFTTESTSEIEQIILQYKKSTPPQTNDFTRGLYYRKV